MILINSLTNDLNKLIPNSLLHLNPLRPTLINNLCPILRSIGSQRKLHKGRAHYCSINIKFPFHRTNNGNPCRQIAPAYCRESFLCQILNNLAHRTIPTIAIVPLEYKRTIEMTRTEIFHYWKS